MCICRTEGTYLDCDVRSEDFLASCWRPCDRLLKSGLRDLQGRRFRQMEPESENFLSGQYDVPLWLHAITLDSLRSRDFPSSATGARRNRFFGCLLSASQYQASSRLPWSQDLCFAALSFLPWPFLPPA